MPSQMSATQIERFIRSMMDQGVGVTRTKKGLLLRLPDGGSTTVHFTVSDVRAQDNLMARLRRAGVRHPDDPKNVAHLPDNITNAVVAPRSKEKIMKAIKDAGYPEYVRVLDLAESTGMVHITISRTLHAMGFIPIIGKRNARDWKTPEEILAMKPESDTISQEAPPMEPMDLTDDEAHAFEEAMNPTRDAAEEARLRALGSPDRALDRFGQTQEEQEESGLSNLSNDLEFIDTRDSWVVPLEKLVGIGLWPIIQDRFQILDVLGMDYEVRVWRR